MVPVYVNSDIAMGYGAMTPKVRRFIEEYVVDFNATQAAIRAGYSEKSAGIIGFENLRKPIIKEAIAQGRAEMSEASMLDALWVLEGLKENYDRAMQHHALYNKDGTKTGEYQYQGSVANRSLELIGKHLGMFADSLKVTGADGQNLKVELDVKDTLLARIAAIVARTSTDSDTQ